MFSTHWTTRNWYQEPHDVLTQLNNGTFLICWMLTRSSHNKTEKVPTWERIVISAAFTVSDQECSVVVSRNKQAFLCFNPLDLPKVPTAKHWLELLSCSSNKDHSNYSNKWKVCGCESDISEYKHVINMWFVWLCPKETRKWAYLFEQLAVQLLCI